MSLIEKSSNNFQSFVCLCYLISAMKLVSRFKLVLLTSQLVESKALWSSSPASFDDVIRQAYPIGNGRLGGMLWE